MKRKLALALAMAMTITATSGLSVSAATSAYISGTIYAYDDDYIVVDDSLASAYGNTAFGLGGSTYKVAGGTPYLYIDFDQTLTSKQVIEIELDNADFFYYGTDSTAVNNTGKNFYGGQVSDVTDSTSINYNVSRDTIYYEGNGEVVGDNSTEATMRYVPSNLKTTVDGSGELSYTMNVFRGTKDIMRVTIDPSESNGASGSSTTTYVPVAGTTPTPVYYAGLVADVDKIAYQVLTAADVAAIIATTGNAANLALTDFDEVELPNTAGTQALNANGDALYYAMADYTDDSSGAPASTAKVAITGSSNYVTVYGAGYIEVANTTGNELIEAAAQIAGVTYTAATINGNALYADASTNKPLYIKLEANTVATTAATNNKITSNSYIKIPLLMQVDDEDAVTLTVDKLTSNLSSGVAGTYTVSASGTGSKLTADSVKTGKKSITLDRIRLRENSAGSFNSGTATLELDSNFEFKTGGTSSSFATNGTVTLNYMKGLVNGESSTAKIYATEAAAKSAAGITGSVVWGDQTDTYIYYGADNQSIVIRFGKALDGSRTSPVVLYFTGLVVTGEDGDTPSEGEIVELSTVNDSAGVTEETIKIATFTGYSLTYSAADAKELEAGILENAKEGGTAHTSRAGYAAAKVTVEEATANKTWWVDTETTFTLTDAEGNKLSGVKFTDVNIDYSNVNTDTTSSVTDWKGQNTEGNYNASDYVYFSKDGASFYLNDGQSQTNNKAKAVITPYLSIDLAFSGDVYLKVSGDGVPASTDNIENSGIVKIATVPEKIAIDTKTTSVQIGFQTINVSDITITELDSGVFKKDGEIILSLGEYLTSGSQDIYFTPITASQVSTTGDVKVELTSGSSTSRVISLDVTKASKTASSITISGLSVRGDRSVPVGTWELNVSGTALRDNADDYLNDGVKTSADDYKRYAFDTLGYTVKNYVKVISQTGNEQLNAVVTIYNNSATVIVDGETVELDAPTKNIDGRLYVPLRFLAEVFGATGNQIAWDDVTRNVQITLGGETITWTQDSEYYVKGGVRMAMAEDGVISKAFISTDEDAYGRTYIPFRYLGYAFNIPVSYDEATGAATYNAID